MGAWDNGSTLDSVDSAFLDDVEHLSAQALRDKYPGEASSHRNMLSRRKQGFEVDPAWQEFRAFLRSMGHKPRDGQRWTLDRLDPEVRRYGPGLCRWATDEQQTINRSNTVWVDYRGERVRLREAAEREGLDYKRAHYLWKTRGEVRKDAAPQVMMKGQYCPLRHQGNPEGADRWRSHYREWFKRVRPDKRHLAPPEVFDIIQTSELYNLLAKEVERYVTEIAPSEYEQAEAFWASEKGLVHRNAFAWIDHAIAALTARDPKLAERFAQQRPRPYWEYWRWNNFLTAAQDP